MVTDKAKKSKLAKTGQDVDSDPVDGELVLSIKKLQEVQAELEKVNEEASDKVLEVEQKYNEMRKQVYDRRNEIIKSIPDFWLTAFLNLPPLCDLLTEEDQRILKYLDSLDVEVSKDMKLRYSIIFNFKENPYFEDSKLTKTFTFFDDGTSKITRTTIKWKECMGAAVGVHHETKGNKHPLACESFFGWYNGTQQREFVIFGDEVAEKIKEDLWPNPLDYFKNCNFLVI